MRHHSVIPKNGDNLWYVEGLEIVPCVCVGRSDSVDVVLVEKSNGRFYVRMDWIFFSKENAEAYLDLQTNALEHIYEKDDSEQRERRR